MRILALTGMMAAGLVTAAGPICAQEAGSPAPSVAVPPPASATPSPAPPDAVRKRAAEKAMTERRQREQAAVQQEAQRKIEQLPPQERESFKRNLRLWGELSPQKREAVRLETNERMRAAIEKALQETGLHLDQDRREVFAVRYRQERRRLERELQEKLEAERARRLPGIIDGLKREFAEKEAVPAPPPPPVAKASPSVSVPAASPGK